MALFQNILPPITFPSRSSGPSVPGPNPSGGLGGSIIRPSIPGPGPTGSLGGPGTIQSFGGNGSTGLGAGQGPGTQSTGQSADNPFNNSFFFQLPQSSLAGNGSLGTSAPSAPSNGGGGYGQYVPIIVVGVIVAGLGYYLFQRKK